MAIWQVPFELVKRNGFIEFTNDIFIHSLKVLEKTLPQETSWCKDYKQYGNIASTVLEFDFSQVVVESISLRVDLRSITKKQIQEICVFCQKNDLVMVYEGFWYEVTVENFAKIFQISRAHKFLSNPYGFLEELRD